MLNRFFGFLNYKKYLQNNGIDLTCYLKEIHASKALIDVHQKYLQYLHSRDELSQNTRIRMFLFIVSSATSLLSRLGEWCAQSKLDWIVPICLHLEQEYELSIQHLQEISPFNSVEPAVLEVIDEYYRRQRELRECNNNYESIEYYSNVATNIALIISLCISIKQLYHYFSTPTQSFYKQISYDYLVIYNKIDDEITKIVDIFEALSDDDKRSIQFSLNKQLSIEDAVEQDATGKFFLKYFCDCKQGPIVHPIKVIIEVKAGEKITKRSEIYDAYFFFGYLHTQVNSQEPMRTPTGAPVAKYQFSNEINKAHQEYWVALNKETKQLSLNKREIIPFTLKPR